MTCCIVGVLLTMAFGRIRRIFGGRPVPAAALFAPVAWRPAPGQSAPEVAAEPIAEVPRGTAVFGYCALAIALCLVAGPVLVLGGVLPNTGSPLSWVLRSALYGVAAAAAFALGRSTSIWQAPRGAGTLLVVLGAIVFELSLLDMHVFGLFAVPTSDVAAMMVFHNVGPAIAMAGGLVLGYGSLGRSMTSWRSSRSTLTRARPSSSAVTVSSTPPLTT